MESFHEPAAAFLLRTVMVLAKAKPQPWPERKEERQRASSMVPVEFRAEPAAD
jgi:hypothetical protein